MFYSQLGRQVVSTFFLKKPAMVIFRSYLFKCGVIMFLPLIFTGGKSVPSRKIKSTSFPQGNKLVLYLPPVTIAVFSTYRALYTV